MKALFAKFFVSWCIASDFVNKYAGFSRLNALNNLEIWKSNNNLALAFACAKLLKQIVHTLTLLILNIAKPLQ